MEEGERGGDEGANGRARIRGTGEGICGMVEVVSRGVGSGWGNAGRVTMGGVDVRGSDGSGGRNGEWDGRQ